MSKINREDWESKPYIKYEDIELLVEDGYYDGPISGICLYKSALYYYAFVDEVSENKMYELHLTQQPLKNNRCYALFQLTEEELKEFFYWEMMWQIYGDKKRTQEEHKYFHEQKKLKAKELNLRKEQIVAWFLDC